MFGKLVVSEAESEPLHVVLVIPFLVVMLSNWWEHQSGEPKPIFPGETDQDFLSAFDRRCEQIFLNNSVRVFAFGYRGQQAADLRRVLVGVPRALQNSEGYFFYLSGFWFFPIIVPPPRLDGSICFGNEFEFAEIVAINPPCRSRWIAKRNEPSGSFPPSNPVAVKFVFETFPTFSPKEAVYQGLPILKQVQNVSLDCFGRRWVIFWGNAEQPVLFQVRPRKNGPRRVNCQSWVFKWKPFGNEYAQGNPIIAQTRDAPPLYEFRRVSSQLFAAEALPDIELRDKGFDLLNSLLLKFFQQQAG